MTLRRKRKVKRVRSPLESTGRVGFHSPKFFSEIDILNLHWHPRRSDR